MVHSPRRPHPRKPRAEHAACQIRARSVPDGAETHGHSRTVRGRSSEAKAQVKRVYLTGEDLPSSAYKGEVGRSRPSVPTAVSPCALTRNYFTITRMSVYSDAQKPKSKTCSASIPTRSFAVMWSLRRCGVGYRQEWAMPNTVTVSTTVRPETTGPSAGDETPSDSVLALTVP